MPSLRGPVLYVALLATDVLGAYSLLVATGLFRAAAIGPNVLWLALLAGILVGLFTWASSLLPLPEGVRRSVLFVGTAGVVALVAVAGSALGANVVVTLLLATIVAWRGISQAAEPIEYDDARRHFTLALGMLFIGIVWIIALRTRIEQVEWTEATFAGIGLVLIAMVALALARQDTEHERGAGRGVAAVMVGAILLLSLIALAALHLFAIDILGSISVPLAPLAGPAGWLVDTILGFVLAPLFALLALARRGHVRPVIPRSPAFHHIAAHNHPSQHGTPVVGQILTIALVLLVFAGIGWLLWRMTPTLIRRRKQAKQRRGTARSLTTPSLLWRQFGRWLRSLFTRSVEIGSTGIAATRRRILGPPYPDDPVRRAYARVLRQATLAGLPRPQSATPAEFEDQIRSRWPGLEAELRMLTQAYEMRRYGGVTPESTVRLNVASRRLCKLIRASPGYNGR